MTHFAKQTFVKTLKQAGYSVTEPRRLVFEILFTDNKPYSMNELGQKIKGKVDRASLYRTTRLFEELGIVRRVTIGWKHKFELSEHFSSHHHHMHCKVCGKTIDIKEPPQLENYIQAVAYKHGFKVTSHSFEIEGTCKDCLGKSKMID